MDGGMDGGMDGATPAQGATPEPKVRKPRKPRVRKERKVRKMLLGPIRLVYRTGGAGNETMEFDCQPPADIAADYGRVLSWAARQDWLAGQEAILVREYSCRITVARVTKLKAALVSPAVASADQA